MADLTEAFGVVADAQMWEESAAVLAGFLAPSIARNVAEGRTSFDIPDEAYGVAVMVAGNYSPAYSAQIMLGGGVYSADKALERVGLKQTITSVGGA